MVAAATPHFRSNMSLAARYAVLGHLQTWFNSMRDRGQPGLRDLRIMLRRAEACPVNSDHLAVDDTGAAVKAAPREVVDLLHQCADFHCALQMPDRARLADTATYQQQLCFSIMK
jgi:hypothetical protein